MKRNSYGILGCLKSYRFHSIFWKNLILFAGMIVLPFLCAFFVSYYTNNMLKRNEERVYKEKMSMLISKDTENLFYELMDKIILLGIDDDIELFCYAKSIEKDDYYGVTSILKNISLHKVSSGIIDNIYIYAPRSQAVISGEGRYYYDDFFDKGVIEQWTDNESGFKFSYLQRDVFGKEQKNICLYYTIHYEKDCKGAIMFLIDIYELARQLNYGDDVDLVITQGDFVIFESMQEWIGQYIDNIEQVMPLEESGMSSYALDKCGLELTIQLHNPSLYVKPNKISMFIWSFIGIIMVITTVLVFYISMKIFNPIAEILNMLKKANEEDGAEIVLNKDEWSYIIQSISNNLSRKEDVETQLQQRIISLKKAQAMALQSQINPHFVNNTLEAINWLAIKRLGDENDVSEMLNCFSSLLRASFRNSDTFITLEEEIEYVKKYLTIQKMRLGDKFDVTYNVSDELKQCKVIKMVLQPIVENAIKYGIVPYSYRGLLCIEALRENDTICICVRDSGFGITSEEVKKINASIREVVIKESDHIGLSNVNQRIILAFGEEYGVWINSEINIGTSVVMKLPYYVKQS